MMKKRFSLKILSGAALALALSGCGFQPMHGTAFQSEKQATVQEVLSQVEIGNIPDREGQYLRNALIDRFYTQGRPAYPKYELSVSEISESRTELDITKSSDATRAQLRLATAIQLTDTSSGEVLLTRNLHAVSSYNVLGSEFATRVSEKNTRENALQDLARQIELHIGLYLNHHGQ